MLHQSASSGTTSAATSSSVAAMSVVSDRSRPASTISRRAICARVDAVTSSVTFMTSAGRPSPPLSTVAFDCSHCCSPVARSTRRISIGPGRSSWSARIQDRPSSPIGRPSGA